MQNFGGVNNALYGQCENGEFKIESKVGLSVDKF